jgi:predicted ATP-binding protein involved in virulence
MKITSIYLKNFRGFREVTIPFPNENVVVLIGRNGAGKSSVLDAIGKLLSELSYRQSGDKRQHLSTEDIYSGEKEAACRLTLLIQNKELDWTFKRKADINTQPRVVYSLNTNDFRNQIKTLLKKTSPENNKPLFLNFDSGHQANTENFLKWYKELILFESFLKNKKTYHTSIKEAIEQAILKLTGVNISAEIAENLRSIKPVFYKKECKLTFFNLSAGEQRIIDLIGKIVSYFIVSFQTDKEKLLDFEGIVLLDEIEKHLHPQWQRDIISNLQNTFPNLQFIVSTHSPQVVSNVSHRCILYLEDFNIRPVPHTLGRDVNSILYDLFQVSKRSEVFQQKINDIYHMIDNQEFENARQALESLKTEYG